MVEIMSRNCIILEIFIFKAMSPMKPSVFKTIQLFSVQNISELCNLGKYLYLATKKRNESSL